MTALTVVVQVAAAAVLAVALGLGLWSLLDVLAEGRDELDDEEER